MLAYEQIIEAIEYANTEEDRWWGYFSSKSEAREILQTAEDYEPEEYEVIQLADILDEDFPSSHHDIYKVYISCLRTLKRQLK